MGSHFLPFYAQRLRALGLLCILAVLAFAGVCPASAQQDTTPPVLVSLDYTPKQIDTTTGPATVTLTAHFTDDLAGVSYGVAYFISPSTSHAFAITIAANDPYLTGTIWDGSSQTSADMPQFSESGSWTLGTVFLEDKLGNRAYYDTAQLQAMGITTTLEVTSVQDTTPPVLVSLDYSPKQIDTTTGPAAVILTAHFTDDLAGVSYGVAYFISPSTSHAFAITIAANDPYLTGTIWDGSSQTSADMPQFSESGSWTLGTVFLEDKLGNRAYYDTAQLQAMGITTTLEVTSVQDTTPPVLVSLDYSPKQIDTTTGPAAVTLTAHFTDDLAGVSYGVAYFISPSTSHAFAITIAANDPYLTGTIWDGSSQTSADMPQFSESGSWTLGTVFLEDKLGNRAYYDTAQLQAMGITTTLINSPAKASTAVAVSSLINPSVFNQSVGLTAVVTSTAGIPTGTVHFLADGADIGSATLDASGTATLGVASLTAGTHIIAANYDGDASFDTSSSSLTQTVNQAATITTVVSSLNLALVTQPVLFTATVTGTFGGTATGTITFKEGSKPLGTATLSGGQASLSHAFPTSGRRSITAVYSGDANFVASTSASFIQVVNRAASTATLSSSGSPSVYGQPVTFTATVSSSIGPPADGETVTFRDGLLTLGTGTLSGGVATFTTSTLLAANHTIRAYYSGSASLASSASLALKQTVNKAATATSIASSLNPSRSGQRVTFTVTVTGQYGGTPSGTVTLKDGTRMIGVAIVWKGIATYSTSALKKGSHTIKAEYGPLLNFASSSASLTQVVN